MRLVAMTMKKVVSLCSLLRLGLAFRYRDLRTTTLMAFVYLAYGGNIGRMRLDYY